MSSSSPPPAPPAQGQASPAPSSPPFPPPAALDYDRLSPPLPDSPALKPVSPRGFSNISSLASSLEMAHPFRPMSAFPPAQPLAGPQSDSAHDAARRSSLDDCPDTARDAEPHVVHSETQALMQMLSMVGSRFFDAEGQGIMEDDDLDEADDDILGQPPRRRSLTGELETESAAALDPTAWLSSRSRRLRTDRGLYPGRHEAFDDQATPLGGQTPLEASAISVHRAKKPPTSPFGSHSETAQRRSQARAKRQDDLAGRQSSRHPFAEASADTGEEGDSEDSGTDEPRSAVDTAPGPSHLDDGPRQSLETQDDTTEAKSAPMPSEASTSRLQPPFEVLPPEGSGAADDALPRRDEAEQLLVQLRRLFDLEPTEELLSAHRCWLFRSILLQGHVYLTTGHLCFYAYLPSRENRLLRSGPIAKLTRRTHRFSKHWATLRSGLLSWFDSARDPYFPQGFIDLRRVSAVEASSKHLDRFKVTTPYRRFTFQVESEASRNAWITALRKEVFKAHNEGESVKISIPLETVIDVDTTLSVDQTEMVCIKVVDELAGFAIDEYFFLHLSRRDEFLRTTKRIAFGNSRSGADPLRWSRASIQDSTGGMANTVTLPNAPLDEVPALPISTTLRRQGSSASAKTMSAARAGADASNGSALKAEGEAGQRPIAIPRLDAAKGRPAATMDADADHLSCTPTARTVEAALGDSSFVYPPSPTGSEPPPSFEQVQKEAEQGWALPKWIKDTPNRMLGGGSAADALAGWMGGTSRRRHRRIVELWPKDTHLGDDDDQDARSAAGEDLSNSGYSSFSVLDAPDEDRDAPTEAGRFEEQFRETFGLPEDERLVGHVHATLFRVLPITGRAFVSTRHLAFRSSGIAQKTVGRTLMLIPLSDVVSAARQPAFRFGQHGVVVTVRGHEEVFLELASAERRDEMLSLIDLQLDHIRADDPDDDDLAAVGGDAAAGSERSNALVLRDLSEQLDQSFDSASASTSTLSSHLSMLGQSSASMMRSDSSALLSFKPAKPLVFTMLTIGSRGDVQPYIALGKGLQADGHRVRIATHPEFGDWVKGHGIEFSGIGGDPAELMRICVENGTFTVSFLREGVTKFRGWLDDLLLSSWHACQGSDVIIESPSAIAGIHVAEALQVPYYRAFTMPWTRTRAYPHAFAVPGNKAGGNYNYMSYVIFDQIFWRAAAGQINRWRKKHLGLRSTNIDKLEQHKVPFIYNFSPSLVPRPLDWFEWIHVTGFWFLDGPDNSSSRKWQPPADLVAFIDRARVNGRKLVYIGWGSIVVSDAEAMTRCVLEAVKKSGVCAIISKGWSDRLSSGSNPGSAVVDPAVLDDVFQVSSVPHDWLFPLIDAACHHGGAGTLGASLRAGLPTIVKPYFGDQFFWGQQVESLGVGSCVKNLTADALAAALRTATTNAKQIERARALGAQIRAEDGVGEAIKAIYRDLDYARGRIKRDTRLPTETQRGQGQDADSTPLLQQGAMPPRADVNDDEQPHDGTAARAAGPVTDAVQAAADTSHEREHEHEHGSCSAEHTSDEWSDVGGPLSPAMSGSHDDPSSSLFLSSHHDAPTTGA